MKKVFFFLLAVNFLFAAILFFHKPGSHAPASASQVVNPEKIVSLPATIDCTEWGPFPELQIATAQEAIDTLNLDTPYRQIMSNTLTQFKVHTKPFENRQIAEREINKLRNMGIVSYRILDQGALFNAIFFGEFSDQISAQNLQKKLSDKGIINVTISEYSVEYTKFLFFEMDEHKITELQALTQQFPDSKLTHKTCKRL